MQPIPRCHSRARRAQRVEVHDRVDLTLVVAPARSELDDFVESLERIAPAVYSARVARGARRAEHTCVWRVWRVWRVVHVARARGATHSGRGRVVLERQVLESNTGAQIGRDGTATEVGLAL